MKNCKQIEYEEFDNIDSLSETDRLLLQTAFKSAEKAYAPYSKYHVGAAILLDNNEIIAGNNQENAAYPSGQCAERVTAFYASAIYPDQTMKAIAITAISEESNLSMPPFPCGSCRQVLAEYESRQQQPIRIILYAQNGHLIIFKSVQDLLPWAFVTH
ncbi:MAG: cytidine deaminase [Bacteroidales bacterium]|nr:cytidine deaminase [Bacteroidales bacterium]